MIDEKDREPSISEILTFIFTVFLFGVLIASAVYGVSRLF